MNIIPEIINHAKEVCSKWKGAKDNVDVYYHMGEFHALRRLLLQMELNGTEGAADAYKEISIYEESLQGTAIVKPIALASCPSVPVPSVSLQNV